MRSSYLTMLHKVLTLRRMVNSLDLAIQSYRHRKRFKTSCMYQFLNSVLQFLTHVETKSSSLPSIIPSPSFTQGDTINPFMQGH